MMSLPPIRATDRERENTVEVLRAAFAAGCLDSDELAERAGLAYAAVTIDDLYGLVGDLPGGPEPASRSRPGGHAARRALGWEFSLMLTVGGAWLIITALHSAAAVPFILLWLVVLRALGWLPRLAARRTAVSRKREI
jgi:DUF1707 SHOCT-like domain